MVKRIFHSKIFVLFLTMILTGFVIGYTYSVLTSGKPEEKRVNTLEDLVRESKADPLDASEHE